jgi:hypothetical protein
MLARFEKNFTLIILIAFYSSVFLATFFTILNAFAETAPGKSDFQQTVLPILKDSCFACHAPGETATYTGSDEVLAKKIKKEVSDGTEDFPMGRQFPFPDDESTATQLKHLEKELSKGLMPPEAHEKLGLGQPLSDPNRKILLNWIDQQKKTVQTP